MALEKGLLFILLLITGICSCKAPKDLVYQNVQNFKLQQAGLEKTAVCMDIRLYNPNRYTIKLKKADVEVFLNGTSLGRMMVNGKVSVGKLDTCSVPVTLNLDLKNALPNAFQLLMSSDMNVKLVGFIKAGRRGWYIKVPVNYEGKQDIRSGIKW